MFFFVIGLYHILLYKPNPVKRVGAFHVLSERLCVHHGSRFAVSTLHGRAAVSLCVNTRGVLAVIRKRR